MRKSPNKWNLRTGNTIKGSRQQKVFERNRLFQSIHTESDPIVLNPDKNKNWLRTQVKVKKQKQKQNIILF